MSACVLVDVSFQDKNVDNSPSTNKTAHNVQMESNGGFVPILNGRLGSYLPLSK